MVNIKKQRMKRKKKFKFRAFVSLTIFWTFIVEALSGLILYTVPPGRIADWAHWEFLGFTKGGWEMIHTIFGYLFLIFVSIHLYKNWKSIVHYIKRKVRRVFQARVELGVSLALVVIVFVGAVFSIPPFRSVMDLGSVIKDTWPENKEQPFLVRAEKLSMDQFLRLLDIPFTQAYKVLRENGVEIKDKKSRVIDVAHQNHTSPSNIYKILKKLIPPQKRINRDRLIRKESFFK